MDKNMKHKHHDLIIAWANGAQIEQRFSKKWITANKPQWYEEYEYRVKPIEATLAQTVIAPAHPTRDQIRAVFTEHGFSVKEGQKDLKEYVYEAANALLRLALVTQPVIAPAQAVTEEQIKAALKAACLRSTEESRKDMLRAINEALGIAK